MIKALFFDIDGTLVSFNTHQIPVSTIFALEKAKANGVQIFIATGRPKVIITNLGALEERNLIDGYITMNGGYCFTGDTVISKHPLSKQSADVVLRFATERKIPNIVVGEHDIAICDTAPVFEDLFYGQLGVDVRFKELSGIEAVGDKDIYQLTTFVNNVEEAELAPLIPDCELGRWHPAFVDISGKGCTKQKGIDEIIKHFGIKLEETMAFGDGGNDIPMIRHAHIGVAMGNALDSVKAIADFVADTVDNDGIAKALKHFRVIEN